MPRSEKDRLAAEFEERWIDFQMALSDKRKYPVQQFRVVREIGRRYAEMTKEDALVNRAVVSAVNGMTDYLTCERKRVPEEVVHKAQRLEWLVFVGYDSYFEGYELPGLLGQFQPCERLWDSSMLFCAKYDRNASPCQRFIGIYALTGELLCPGP